MHVLTTIALAESNSFQHAKDVMINIHYKPINMVKVLLLIDRGGILPPGRLFKTPLLREILHPRSHRQTTL
ncbi:hypothetical protein Ct9H90mP29_02920 [bacterium]|nr:MAG: hypothetical protein Ct9H90mP29_02920 [bacterium]